MRIQDRIDPREGGRRIPSPRCGLEGCDVTTSNGKPFCRHHVMHHDYVKRLVEDPRFKLVTEKGIDTPGEQVDGIFPGQ